MSTHRGRLPRVGVVGLGAVTGLGGTAQDLWQGAVAGRPGIGPVQGLDLTEYRTKLGAEVNQGDVGHAGSAEPDGFRDRMTDLAFQAVSEAVQSAVTTLGNITPARRGVVFGTCNAGLLAGREWLAQARAGQQPDPQLAALMPPQVTAEAIAGSLGWGGPVISVNTACASGANALGLAADLVSSGRADAVLAGGADAFSDVLFAGFNSLEALSPEPARPYSADRSGLTLGEGAAFLVLVRDDLLPGRPYAWIDGYGLSADGYHVTAPRPDGSGAARAMRQAMEIAGVSADSVGYVNGHGTGTEKNDVAESRAIQAAVGSEPLVSSTKSVIGHLLGGAGAAEALVTVRALHAQVAPPTASYSGRDSECGLDYVPLDARELRTDVALSNNFAFGGSNACLALVRDRAEDRRPEPSDGPVAITGLSLLSPYGDDIAAVRRALAEAAADVDRRWQPVRTMDVGAEPYLTRRQRRRMDRMTIAGIVAAAKALESAGLPVDGAVDEATGVLLGTQAGPVESMAAFTEGVLDDGPLGADPGLFPNTVYNQPAGQVSARLGLLGPTSTVSAGHASGTSALGYAAELIRTGRADRMVVLAVDLIDERVASAYRGLGLLTRRPGDRRLRLADATVAVVMERADVARRRNASIHAGLVGSGSAFGRSGRWPWELRGEAAERAMRAALRSAGVRAESVQDVWMASTGLGLADRGEAAAVARVAPLAGLHRPRIDHGEPPGSGGALALALAADAMARGDGGPTALINDMSLGGTHVSLVLSNFEE